MMMMMMMMMMNADEDDDDDEYEYDDDDDVDDDDDDGDDVDDDDGDDDDEDDDEYDDDDGDDDDHHHRWCRVVATPAQPGVLQQQKRPEAKPCGRCCCWRIVHGGPLQKLEKDVERKRMLNSKRLCQMSNVHIMQYMYIRRHHMAEHVRNH